jgi:hypothetical protein
MRQSEVFAHSYWGNLDSCRRENAPGGACCAAWSVFLWKRRQRRLVEELTLALGRLRQRLSVALGTS